MGMCFPWHFFFNYQQDVSITECLSDQSDTRYHHRVVKDVFLCGIYKNVSNIIQTNTLVSTQYLNVRFSCFFSTYPFTKSQFKLNSCKKGDGIVIVTDYLGTRANICMQSSGRLVHNTKRCMLFMILLQSSQGTECSETELQLKNLKTKTNFIQSFWFTGFNFCNLQHL